MGNKDISDQVKQKKDEVKEKANEAYEKGSEKLDEAANKASEHTDMSKSDATSKVENTLSDLKSTAESKLEPSKKSKKRYDYSPWEYFLPPESQDDLNHKYSILRRTLMGDNVEKADPESLSLREFIDSGKKSINDARVNIQEGTSLQVRYYASIPLILSPLLLFKRRRPRKMLYSYLLTSYFLVPEPFRAIMNAK